jgi:Creatinine amidohydrolase
MIRQKSRRLDLLPWNKAAEVINRNRIAIVPVGAIEPHGHHAPLGADTFIAQEISERLAEAVDAVVFPRLPLPARDDLARRKTPDRRLHSHWYRARPFGCPAYRFRQRSWPECSRPRNRCIQDPRSGRRRGWPDRMVDDVR